MMFRRVPVALLLLVLLLPAGGCGAGERSAEAEFMTVSYGLFGLVRVRVVRFSPGRYRLRAILPDPGLELQPVASMAGCGQALACFNGSFFAIDPVRPLGLLVSDGRVLQPLRKVSWGVFWVGSDGVPHVTPRKEFAARAEGDGELLFGLQSGPTILAGGELRGEDRSLPARRTAIGIDRQGQVVVLVADFPVGLRSLAMWARDRLEMVDLMNLDGGSSTQLRVRLGGESEDVPGVEVAVGVGLFESPAGASAR